MAWRVTQTISSRWLSSTVKGGPNITASSNTPEPDGYIHTPLSSATLDTESAKEADLGNGFPVSRLATRPNVGVISKFLLESYSQLSPHGSRSVDQVFCSDDLKDFGGNGTAEILTGKCVKH